jgi:hypothetical protein
MTTCTYGFGSETRSIAVTELSPREFVVEVCRPCKGDDGAHIVLQSWTKDNRTDAEEFARALQRMVLKTTHDDPFRKQAGW